MRLASRRFCRKLFPKRDERGVEPQLQDGADAPPGFPLELLQGVQVPRVDHERFLADRIGADAKRQPDVRVMEIIRRADADVVHAIGVGAAAQLLEMPIEALDLGEKPDVEGVGVENADGVVRIDRGHQAMTGVLDGLQVARRDVAGGAGQREVARRLLVHAVLPSRCRDRSTTSPSAAASFGAFTRSEYRSSIVRRPAAASRCRSSRSASSRPSLSIHSLSVAAKKPLTPS